MTCLLNLEVNIASGTAAALWVVCALVLVSVVRNNRFAGKPAFVLTLASMLWWLFTVTLDLASHGEACKIAWSLAAWPGITLLPIAWAFFVLDYTMNAHRGYKWIRLLLYIGLPSMAGLIALSNGQTHLLYGTGTHLVVEGEHSYVEFEHGPLFYAVAAGLYVFVVCAIGALTYALFKAQSNIHPFLGLLILITAAPLVGNLAYIGWGFTFFGFDPTPFLFTVALIALSWLLLNNTMMDTEALGRSLLFYATDDPVIIMDAEGRFSGANPAACSVFGKKIPKYGRSLDHLEKIGPILTSFREKGELANCEPLRLQGRVFDMRVLPIESPIRSSSNLLGWAISLVDITERERSAEVLRDAVAHAEAANVAKSQFLAMISHELRTPMTSVKGGLDLALHGAVGEVSAPLRDLLVIAQRNSLRLLKLIDDVLDLQKLDLSTMNIETHVLDADAFLHDLVEEYEAYATEAEVELAIVSGRVDKQISGDSDRLKQVVGNVVSNAVKFSPKGGCVECAMQVTGTNLRVSVKDSGIGIPEDEQHRVFGRFSQVDGSTSRASEGSGLGMHIAKLLIERMGGAISYESELGRGTTFYIDIPLAPVEAEIAAPADA
ncbi:histidine kinase N-terminal 7TM domain-containing protein [Celeribacter sp. ULVN23_4]